MVNREQIFQTLQAHKSELTQLGIRAIGLFGSYLKGKQTPESDIYLLLDFFPDKENFDNYMAVCDKLEDLFQGEIRGVVTLNGLSPHIGPSILREVQYV